jgi:hypothetical protein
MATSLTLAAGCAGGGEPSSSFPRSAAPMVTGTLKPATTDHFVRIKLGMTAHRVRAVAGSPARAFLAVRHGVEGRCWVYDEIGGKVGAG